MKVKKNQFLESAFAAADWFVNSQIIEKRPNWNANNGRFLYHIHMPTGYTTLGLNWSMARGVMVLLSAYVASKKKVYLNAATSAINYNKTLQVLDKRDHNFGAFREATPQSPFCYPRDGIETAQGFLMYYRVTGDKECLYRGNIYLDWYLKNGLKSDKTLGKWTIPEVRFDNTKPELTKFEPYQAGGGQVFANSYLLTKKNSYKLAAINLANGTINHWLKASKIDGGSFLGSNDDGASISSLLAYKITKKEKYLTSIQNSMERYISEGYNDSSYAGLPCTLNTLIELNNISKDKRIIPAVGTMANTLLTKQASNGGFIGEDEPANWYVENGKPEEFVVTRVTAYAALALFKLAGYKGFGYTVSL